LSQNKKIFFIIKGRLYSRDNIVAHLTASSFIVNVNKKSVLMLMHKTLQRGYNRVAMWRT